MFTLISGGLIPILEFPVKNQAVMNAMSADDAPFNGMLCNGSTVDFESTDVGSIPTISVNRPFGIFGR